MLFVLRLMSESFWWMPARFCDRAEEVQFLRRSGAIRPVGCVEAFTIPFELMSPIIANGLCLRDCRRESTNDDWFSSRGSAWSCPIDRLSHIIVLSMHTCSYMLCERAHMHEHIAGADFVSH